MGYEKVFISKTFLVRQEPGRIKEASSVIPERFNRPARHAFWRGIQIRGSSCSGHPITAFGCDNGPNRSKHPHRVNPIEAGQVRNLAKVIVRGGKIIARSLVLHSLPQVFTLATSSPANACSFWRARWSSAITGKATIAIAVASRG